MSSFWRRFCKGIFYVSFVVSELGVVVVSAKLFKTDDWWWLGLIVLLFGGFLMVMLHAFFGAALEMMYNIAALREKYCGVYENGSDEDDISHTGKAEEDDDYQNDEVSSEKNYVQWKCPKCGAVNEGINRFCASCGLDIDSYTARVDEQGIGLHGRMF